MDKNSHGGDLYHNQQQLSTGTNNKSATTTATTTTTTTTTTTGDNSMAFWKKNSKTVPGRPSRPSVPKLDTSWTNKVIKNSVGGVSEISFQEYQNSVEDAWDPDVDDFVMSSDVKYSKKLAQSSALSVINYHRIGKSSTPVPSTVPSSVPQHLISTHPEIHQNQHQIQNQSQSLIIPSGPTPTSQSRTESGICDEVYASLRISSSTSAYQPHNHHHRNNTSKPQVISRKESDSGRAKAEKVRNLLEVSTSTDLKELQSLSYSGLPVSVRGTAWKLLAGYLPASLERRKIVLDRKREEYWNCVQYYYDSRLDESHQDTFRQIHIDIPRMCPLIALFQQKVVQEVFERILFIWAIRHPASGYVQGMNDLVTPFFVVFLEECLPQDSEVELYEVSDLPEELRNNIEADSYWCMSKFLDSIQVNYIFAQTGIQEKVRKLKELIERIDASLHSHLQKHEIDYLQFSFRWMNNLLMREIPLRCTIRLWDTYLAEPDGCGSILLYVCAAFLRHWRAQIIKQKDFQGLMLLLQNLPTQNWESDDISLIVAEAYRLKYTFDSAPKHLGHNN